MGQEQLAILYADVSGSTRIYETYGDAEARSNIEKCLELLAAAATQGGGAILKTIGDEIMCSFPDPLKAALAAGEMQQALSDANEDQVFSVGELHVKIGWHYGAVEHRGAEVVGEAPVTAQQVIGLAKGDEILASEQGLAGIPQELKRNARLIDAIEAEAYAGMLNVYSLPWEDDGDVTRTGSLSSNPDEMSRYKALVLDYPGGSLRLDSENRHCSVGRGPENDISVLGHFTSRKHAELSYKHGMFHLRDYSTNGTVLQFANGRSARLRREEMILMDKGLICFGGLPENDPAAVVQFRCETAG